MIRFLITFSLSLSVWNALAADDSSLRVNVPSGEVDETTLIQVKKGKNVVPTGEAKYEITQGEDELEGEPAPLQKEARANWKKACDDWKRETKEMNKDNQVLTLNCGTAGCTTSAMNTVCKSRATHKIKVKMN